MIGPSCIKPISAQRRGVVLIAVLACVAIITILLGTMIKSTIDWRRQVRYETWNQQADWLAESGLRKAVFQLGRNSEYAGEQWKLEKSDELPWAATIDITLDDSPQKTIHVLVTLAEETGRPIRSRRTLAISEIKDPEE